MKKIYLYIPLLLVLLFSSCKKEDAVKDVESAINKLNYFNETFNTLYSDGVISKEKPNENSKSEFETLKSIASEYYDLMNKINKTIKEEKKKGKSEYTTIYNNTLKEKEKEINEATQLFEENISKLE